MVFLRKILYNEIRPTGRSLRYCIPFRLKIQSTNRRNYRFTSFPTGLSYTMTFASDRNEQKQIYPEVGSIQFSVFSSIPLKLRSKKGFRHILRTGKSISNAAWFAKLENGFQWSPLISKKVLIRFASFHYWSLSKYACLHCTFTFFIKVFAGKEISFSDLLTRRRYLL